MSVAVGTAQPRMAPPLAVRIFQVQHAAQLLVQSLGVEIADQLPVLGNRNLAGLLGDDDGDRVRLLGDTERGAVTRPQLGGGGGVVRKW